MRVAPEIQYVDGSRQRIISTRTAHVKPLRLKRWHSDCTTYAQ
jgi:hypothetical protein